MLKYLVGLICIKLCAIYVRILHFKLKFCKFLETEDGVSVIYCYLQV